MVIIRLSRVGRKNRPSFRIVVQEKRRSPSSVVLETIGHYHPLENPAALTVKEDRVKHWVDRGAHISNTLHNLLVERKVIAGTKRAFVRAKKKEAEEQPATPAAPAPEKKEEAKA